MPSITINALLLQKQPTCHNVTPTMGHIIAWHPHFLAEFHLESNHSSTHRTHPFHRHTRNVSKEASRDTTRIQTQPECGINALVLSKQPPCHYVNNYNTRPKTGASLFSPLQIAISLSPGHDPQAITFPCRILPRVPITHPTHPTYAFRRHTSNFSTRASTDSTGLQKDPNATRIWPQPR